MAKVSIKDFDWNKDYYAYVCLGGYECYYGRFRAWKLYSLTGNAVRTLGQDHSEIEALFESQDELEAYITAKHTQPAPEPEEMKVVTIGKGPDKLYISQVM